MFSSTKKKKGRGSSNARRDVDRWSEWKYSEIYGCESRWKDDENGKEIWEHRRTQPEEGNNVPSYVPRTPGPAPGLTANPIKQDTDHEAVDGMEDLEEEEEQPSYGYQDADTTATLVAGFSQLQVSQSGPGSRDYPQSRSPFNTGATVAGPASYAVSYVNPSAPSPQQQGYPAANIINNATASGTISSAPVLATSAPAELSKGKRVTRKEYQLHHTSFFQLGHIFKTNWIEPRGSQKKAPANNTYESVANESVFEVSLGEAYATIRRFVIVRQQEGHSICLPILTYKGQGARKPGAKYDHHAIIYTEPIRPRNKTGEFIPKLADGEPELLNAPICMKYNHISHRLDPLSRLNYAKSYTVEHNTKVCFIGRVAKESWKDFQDGFNRLNQPLSQPSPAEGRRKSSNRPHESRKNWRK